MANYGIWHKRLCDTDVLICEGEIVIELQSAPSDRASRQCVFRFMNPTIEIVSSNERQCAMDTLKTRLRLALASLEAMDD